MHEVDMTKALIQTVRDWWQAQPGAPSIAAIQLAVGQFTCVEPASLQFAFAAQTPGTFLDGATLKIREIPLIAFCHTCQGEYRPAIGAFYACPSCGTPMEDIRSGRELKIEHIEYNKAGEQPCSTPHPSA